MWIKRLVTKVGQMELFASSSTSQEGKYSEFFCRWTNTSSARKFWGAVLLGLGRIWYTTVDRSNLWQWMALKIQQCSLLVILMQLIIVPTAVFSIGKLVPVRLIFPCSTQTTLEAVIPSGDPGPRYQDIKVVIPQHCLPTMAFAQIHVQTCICNGQCPMS